MIVFSRPPGKRRRAGDVWTSSSVADAIRWPRKATLRAALQVLRLGAWSAVMLDASQGPRDESVRACKAARRVAYRGHRRASATLDDAKHRRRAASYPEAAKRRSYVSPFYESKY